MNKMNKIWIAVGILVLVVGYFLVYSNEASVSATGTSVIKAQPDLVSVNINVETRGESAQIAQEKNKEISDKLLLGLIKSGYNSDELKFVNYNIYPEYDWKNGVQKFKGYVVSQQLIVKTENVKKVPEIVDIGINSGALVSYINFELSEEKQSEYKKKALEKAGMDAKEKAEATASGVGKRLGRLVSVQSEDFYYGPLNLYDKTLAEASGRDLIQEARNTALNISPQDIEVRATIIVQYKISNF